MRTIRLGTIDEWIATGEDVMLINRKLQYMSNGVCISMLKKLDKPVKVTYHALQPDDYGQPEPFFLCGAGAPYIVKGKFNYTCYASTVYGGGTSYVLSDAQAKDDNWESIERLEDALR